MSHALLGAAAALAIIAVVDLVVLLAFRAVARRNEVRW